MKVEIGPNQADFKNTDKENVKDYNIQEIRGWVIDSLNSIESKIDIIITMFFKPEKRLEFQNIILNTSILSTGAKIKVLKNIPDFESKQISNIQRISSIRNAFAHIPTTKNATVIIRNVGGEIKMTLENAELQLNVMNSSGEIKSRSVSELVDEFQKLIKESSSYLDSIVDVYRKHNL